MFPALRRGIITHFERHRQRSKWDFLWRTWLEALLLSVLVGAVLSLFFDLESRTDLKKLSAIKLVVSLVIIAPFIETLLMQTFPVAIARIADAGFRGQLLAGWVLFALVHFLVSFGTGVAAGVIGGFYLAFTYAHWRQVSLRSAFWTTAAAHALHNLVPAVAILAGRIFG